MPQILFGQKIPKSAHSALLAAQLEGHDRVEGLLQGDGLQPELHVGEHGLSQPQKRPWTQKGSFPSSFGLFFREAETLSEQGQVAPTIYLLGLHGLYGRALWPVLK